MIHSAYITTALSLMITISLFTSCEEEKTKSKIPGSFHSLQMLSSSRAYPAADIPTSGYGEAHAHQNKYFGNSDQNKSNNEPWEAMGPLNTSGRCLALAINPQADSTVYLGTASGGLWRSRKLGLGISWEYVPTADDVLGVSSIAFAPGDSMVMYIGTGEVYNIEQTGNDGAYRATRGSYGVGVLKSIDGGATWRKSLDWTYQNQKGVQSVKVNIKNPDIVYAATTDGIYYSGDAGQSWELVLDVRMATDVEINGNIILASCGNLGSEERGLYRSEDNGQSWSIINSSVIPPDFQGKIELASAPNNPNIVYASIGNGFGFSDGATWLLKTEDAGLNWNLQNNFDYSMWQGWFSHDVAIHPQNPETIVAIGIDIYRSFDSGETLEQRSIGGVTLGTPDIGVPDGPSNYSHSDHHVALYHPNLHNVILFGNDGGLFLSVNGGNTFQSANGGLQSTQFYNGFSVSNQNPDFALGGLQDNSTAIFRGSAAWQRAVGGDGSWTAISFDDDFDVFASSQNLNIAASRDGGQSFRTSRPFEPDDNPVFIAPYVIAPSNSSIMYAGGSYVHVSNDGGRIWLTGNDQTELNGDPIYAMAVSPTNENVVYAATAPFLEQSSLFVSVDGGESFESTDQSQFPNRFINDITVDPIDESKIYITMSGFGSGHLFVSEDYGATFEDISNGLPDVPSNAIEVDPLNSDYLYFGNDIGVYFSANAGSSWEAFDTGLMPSVIAMDLKVSPTDRKIWVATHGNGSFRREMIEFITASGDIPAASDIDVFPNPGNGMRAYLDVNNSSLTHYEVYLPNGKLVAPRSIISQNELVFSSPLTSGLYFIRLYQAEDLATVVRYKVAL